MQSKLCHSLVSIVRKAGLDYYATENGRLSPLLLQASKISERTVRSGALPRKKPLQEYLTKFASHWGAQAADQPWELSAKFVLALFGSICFSFGGSRAAFAINAPPATEDKLLEVVRVVENRLDTATQLVGEVLSSITRAPPTRDLQASCMISTFIET